MHKLLLSVFGLFSLAFLNAQSLILAKQFHGNDSQVTVGVDTDGSGNIYTNTNFYGNVDADPGPGTLNFISAGSLDIAITKLNSAGDFVWGIQLAGVGFGGLSVLKTDDAGNVYVFGIFNGTIDMDPSGATLNLVSTGTDDIFCGKYNTSGTLVWATKIGGTGTEQNYGFDIDSNNDLYLHGYFQNTVDFNPGAGTFNLTAGISGSDFLLKLNNDGSFNYAITMSVAYGNNFMIDPLDNIYITGTYFGTVDFNPGVGVFNLTAAGFSADAFILKLNTDGIFLWAGNISGNNNDQGTTIAYDETTSSVFVGGFFEGTIDADPGPGITNIVSAGYVDGFIIKLNAADGSFVWGKGIGGLGYQQVTAIKISSSGSVHAIGVFDQTCDFDPSGATFNLTSNGYTDIFKMIWTNDGAFTSAEQIGGINGDWSYAIHFDNTEAELITGYFDGIVDFDPGVGVTNLNSLFTGWDGFITKYCTVYTINNDVTICEGDSYFAGGANQTEPGDYYDYYTPVEGCDSIVITHLSVNNPVVDLGPNDGICAGTSIILDAENTGAVYDWNTGAVSQTITVSTAGTYSVTVTDPAGCTASDAITITVDPSPIVNLGADVSICEGENIILNAGNPGSTYLWSTGAVTQTIIVNATGNYSVTVTNGFGCTDNDAVHVTVNPIPVVDLGPNDGICAGTSIILDAENPGAEYDWSTGAITQTISVSTAGTYSVTVSYPGGCTASDAITISVDPSPNVNLGADVSICEGENIILNAGNPGSTYLWSTGAVTQTINITTTGTYSVTVTNGFGCTDNDVVNITVNPIPIVDLGPNDGICAGTSIILDAENPGAEYDWNTGAITQTISVSTAGTYSVTVSYPGGCTASDAITITVDPSPNVNLGADISLCEGEITVLNAGNPGATYLWSTGAVTQTIIANATGNYSVTVTNGFGCTDNDIIHVTVNPTPVIDLGGTISICSDEVLILDAGNAGADYLWNTGATTQMITADVAGDYSVEVTNGFGCSSNDDVAVIINPVPVIDLGADVAFCDGGSVILDATSAMSTYNWSTGETSASITADETGIYSVIVTNTFGCTDADAISVEVFAAPVVDLGGDASFCEGSFLILDATNPSSTYLWSTGETTSSITVSVEGIYSVTVTNTDGCEAFDEVVIGMFTSPVIDLGPDTEICDGTSIILDAATPSCTYVWNTGSTASSITVTEEGLYSVEVTNSFGCVDEDEIFISVIPSPDVSITLTDTTICSDAAPVILTGGSPAGGIYSGDGITDGVFDAAAAGLGVHEITYTFTDVNGCSGEAVQLVEVTICQVVENLSAESLISVYPNPAINNITIKISEAIKISSIEIRDITGKRIKLETMNAFTGDEINYSLGQIPAGNYIVCLLGDNKLITLPLVVVK
ncbi:MAG: T9SS type A sorting domain-containing protein [Chitinophagales bacterium]